MLNLFTNQVADIFIARPNAAKSKHDNNAYKNKEQFTNTSACNDAEGIKYYRKQTIKDNKMLKASH